MNQQSNRVALVTGASRGIGQAVALRLARDGFDIVANYAGNAVKAQETVDAVERLGRKAIAVQGDVSQPDDVARLFATAKEACGRIDVVVNSAGIMTMTPIKPDNVDDFDRTIATNLRGSFLVMSHAAQHLEEGGRIIALSTSVIALSFPGYGPYIASKAATEGLVHVLANELRGRGITVNAVAPGPTGTELFFNGKSAEQLDKIAKLAPLERIGEPDEIAAAVAFLAGPDGAWVNSQVLRVNGGFA
jgi:3-oxoacyl-[acyl-carrier protein] reductase